MVYSNILEAIGNTPLVKLSKIVPEDSAEILVKYEGPESVGKASVYFHSGGEWTQTIYRF